MSNSVKDMWALIWYKVAEQQIYTNCLVKFNFFQQKYLFISEMNWQNCICYD